MAKKPRTHGTHSCYVGGCRQPECIAAHTAYVREWRYRTGRVRSRLVPIEDPR